MGIKNALPKTSIKHRGLFSLSGLLQDVRKWFELNDYEFHEPKHKYKVPTPAGAEMEIIMRGERKINEYLKYYVHIYFHIWEIKDVEMIRQGIKTKANDAKVLVEVFGEYELDWQGRFGGNKFLQELQSFYHKYVIKRTIQDWWEDNLFFKINALTKTIKNSLAFEETKAKT